MPSLQVVREDVKENITEDTYGHFYAHFTSNEIDKYNNYDRNASVRTQTSRMFQLWKSVAMICFLNFVIYWLQFRWVETVNS